MAGHARDPANQHLALLLLLALMLALMGASIYLARAALRPQTQPLDERLLLALRAADNPDDPLGPAWVEEVGRDVTALGGVLVLTLVTAFAAGYLVMARHARTAALLLVAVATGLLLAWLLKGLYDRPRPDLVPHLSHAVSTSFPSGHAMLAAVTYLTLAAIVARAHASAAVRAYLYAAAGLLTLAVGLSRVYLGVHWPTDVAAGWLLGAAWALMWEVVARTLQRRGEHAQPLAIEPPEP